MKTRLAAGAVAAAVVIGAVAIIAVPASSKHTDAVRASSKPAATGAASAKLQLHKGKLGRFLVDSKGMTLYLFEKDKGGKSSCFGACAQGWPPYLVTGKVTAGKGVKASKIGTTKRAGGGTQVTYAGHPLYRYIGDSSAGQTNGEGSKAFGAEWYVVAASGKKIEDD